MFLFAIPLVLYFLFLMSGKAWDSFLFARVGNVAEATACGPRRHSARGASFLLFGRFSDD